MPDTEELSAIAVDIGLKLHKDVGPGLLESAYEMILTEKLRAMGLHVDRQVPVRIEYDNIVIEQAYRIDLLVEHSLLIEVKGVDQTLPLHAKQVLTYLRFMNLSLGLLMNFGMVTFKDGLRRLVNNHPSFASSRLRANHFDGPGA